MNNISLGFSWAGLYFTSLCASQGIEYNKNIPREGDKDQEWYHKIDTLSCLKSTVAKDQHWNSILTAYIPVNFSNIFNWIKVLLVF